MLIPAPALPLLGLVIGLSAALFAPAAGAQQPTAGTAPAPKAESPAQPERQEPHFVVRRYPQDKDKAIAIVGSRTLTLGDLVDHIDKRHYPGFKQALPQPHVQAFLQSDLIAPWVRQFADLEALRQSLGETEIDDEKLEAAQSAALKKAFEGFLESYVASLEQSGRPTQLSQKRVNSLLADFQLKNGLAAELQGMLDYLEPDDFNREQLRNFFNANARYFGGQVTLAQILIQHRDAGTGILLKDEGIARANGKLAEIKARLRPDGSNFEEIARLYSDDTRTSQDGGLLQGVYRFDDRLPATLCKAAWQLQDGEVSADVIETQYGWHLIKRLEFNQQMFILFTDDAIPSIRIVMQRAAQEARLLGAREKVGIRLLL